MFGLQIVHSDATSAARAGKLQTFHGQVDTPLFMPVGTQATVKGLDVAAIKATGTSMVLANTYHLTLRPGPDTIAALGGLHGFMRWNGPILTDSGGFQVYSLAKITQVTEEGVTFRSHLDGDLVEFTPERAVAIQESLGADVAMVLDHVIALPNSPEAILDATERSIRWAQRCRDAHRRTDQVQFAIVQGGLDIDLRLDCTQRLIPLDFPGYAIGGLSVGEPPAEMHRILRGTVAALPANKPRYLMGVGRPEDLLVAIGCGVDMFDCVLPTRNGRNGAAFTDEGVIRMRNRKYERDEAPLAANCPCAACQHSRAYLRHLFMVGEMLGPILLSIHNVTYYQQLIRDARNAILRDGYTEFCNEKLAGWTRGESADGDGSGEPTSDSE